jgi:hypothetical protein
VNEQWPKGAPDAGLPAEPPSVPPPWGGGDGAPAAPPAIGYGPALAPLPPPTPPTADNRRVVLVLCATILVLTLLLAGLGVVIVTRPGEPGAAPGTSVPASAGSPGSAPVPGGQGTTTVPAVPTPTRPPGPAPTLAEVQAATAEISAFVEKQRGLSFKTPVKVELADDTTFEDRLLKDFEKGRDQLVREGDVFKALGLVDSGTDVVAAFRKLLVAGVIGFYDVETKELLVRGYQITPFVRQTMAHELTHALDDQYFDLHRPQYEAEKDEIGTGFSAVVEGNARRVENAFGDAMTPAERNQRDRESAAYALGMDTRGVPVILVSLLDAPYTFGVRFDDALVASGGNDQLGAALTDPPRTSAQVIHPERYLAHDARVEVAKPKADGPETDDGVFGELATRFTLQSSPDITTAAPAAAGWAGDWFVAWRDGQGLPCVRIDYAMVTPEDLAELTTAFTQWAADLEGTKVEAVGNGLLEVTSCAATVRGPSPA